MRKLVNNPEYYKNKFISKAIKKHCDKYDYSEVEYTNSIEKVKIICKKHGGFWVRPDSHVNKVGCPSCKGGVKYTQNDFIRLATISHGGKYDYSNVEYVNSRTKVKILCDKHGYFEMSPANHLIGQGCPSCSGVKRKTLIDFVNQSNIIHNHQYDYSKVQYKNNRVKVEIICKKHGNFMQTPKDHLRGHGCSLCNISKGESMLSKKLTYLGIKFKREFRFDSCVSLSGVKLPFDFYLPDYKILVEYDGRQHYENVEVFGGLESHKNLIKNDLIRNNWCEKNNLKLIRVRWDDEESGINELFKCISDGVNTNVKFNGFLSKSIFDLDIYIKRIESFIEFISSVYDKEISYNHKIGDYFCDIFLVDEGIGFNFLGLFRNSDKCSDPMYQNKINIKFNSENIRLVQIFEDQWCDKQDIIKSRILSILSMSNRIYARNCEIKEVSDNKLIRTFLNKNHLQGFIGSKVKIGLFYKNELVSLMTFGSLRRNLGQKSKEGSYELLRFCNLKNINVIGGASKLFKYFIENFNPNYIVSYADKMWSYSKNVYTKMGMNYIYDSKPSYYYIVGDKRKNRFGYRKNKLLEYGFDKNLSEYQICKSLGINRIYDCGSIKYEWYSVNSTHILNNQHHTS
jgi:very-short-patch-repair endonuclease